MISSGAIKQAIGQLRAILARTHMNAEMRDMVDARDEVLARFGPIFSPETIQALTPDEFQDFLLFRHNKHWTGLHRKSALICQDMDSLRDALATLLDEGRPIEDRLNELILRSGAASVKYLGKAILTPLLLVAYPDKYGVWNGTAEFAMQTLDIWPQFERSTPFGQRYHTVNEVLQALAERMDIDLWTLDALWWQVKLAGDGRDNGDSAEPPEEDTARFGLERHLHEFLRDNWQVTEMAREWELYEEDGDLAGYEYPCSVGRIDLLARHKSEDRWLVVELKRDQSSDATVGQVLRYMGWVQEHLASANDSVEGLIIALQSDDRLAYALRPIPNVRVMLYEVSFRLRSPGPLPDGQPLTGPETLV
jgi:hypothetical protein